MNRYIFRGCARCGGDLYLDDQCHGSGDWQCLQCGHYHRREPAQPPVNPFWAYWRSQAAAFQPNRAGDRTWERVD